jgi:hypothetical protein
MAVAVNEPWQHTYSMQIKVRRWFGLLGLSALWFAIVMILPYLLLYVSQLSYSADAMVNRLGINALITFSIFTLGSIAAGFGVLWIAAGLHQQHASWPSTAVASRKSAYGFLFGYFGAATAISNGIPSWTLAAQSRVFIVVYLGGGFGIVTVLGAWFTSRIGRKIMSLRLDEDKVSAEPAVVVLASSDSVRVVFADGCIRDMPKSEVRDHVELRPFFDKIVSASAQPDQDTVLLLTECGDIYRGKWSGSAEGVASMRPSA